MEHDKFEVTQKTITDMKGTVRNWSEYNAGLKNRGSLTFWLDEAVLEDWYNEIPSGKRGASEAGNRLASCASKWLCSSSC
ncbi:MAG: hypothetical protein RLZZ499_3147 [Cyanobacteriota bacterium]|jgi:hypothetical protein